MFSLNGTLRVGYCRVLTATKANKTERFIRSSALLDTKSTHSLNARSHCSVPVCPARTTAVRYALLLIQPLYTTDIKIGFASDYLHLISGHKSDWLTTRYLFSVIKQLG